MRKRRENRPPAGRKIFSSPKRRANLRMRGMLDESIRLLSILFILGSIDGSMNHGREPFHSPSFEI